MDHGEHGAHGEHEDGTHGGGDAVRKCAMSMIFHGGASECIVFDWWYTPTMVAFVCSALAIFVITFFYEGLKFYREILYAAKAESLRASTKYGSTVQSIYALMFNRFHALQTILHMLQMCISYFLMLVAMTYNAYLILAVIVGAGFGYFFFGWIRQRSVEVEEHCH